MRRSVLDSIRHITAAPGAGHPRMLRCCRASIPKHFGALAPRRPRARHARDVTQRVRPCARFNSTVNRPKVQQPASFTSGPWRITPSFTQLRESITWTQIQRLLRRRNITLGKKSATPWGCAEVPPKEEVLEEICRCLKRHPTRFRYCHTCFPCQAFMLPCNIHLIGIKIRKTNLNGAFS